jgi:hypothetical protein
MRIPKASDISNVDLVTAPDGYRFVKILFTDGDVQLMLADELHRLARRTMNWAMHIEGIDADADPQVLDYQISVAHELALWMTSNEFLELAGEHEL